MTSIHWAVADDVPLWMRVLTIVLVCGSLGLLAHELRRRAEARWRIFLTGVLATAGVSVSVLRPVKVVANESRVGPRVVVLVDQSRRMQLPAEGGSRLDRAMETVAALQNHYSTSRLSALGFSDGPLSPLAPAATRPHATRGVASDLAGALEQLSDESLERPGAIVVVSDGRFSRPAPGADTSAIAAALPFPGVPVHTISVLQEDPPDVSIRSVRAAGVAVAHQPLAITVEVGCSGPLECSRVPVRIRELREEVGPATLASGVAELEDGVGTVELEVTLDSAGGRVVEVILDATPGDAIPGNDRRFITFFVTRNRVRLLHLAGRPTYDVRALRGWLKSDESVDVVAFFILRDSQGDDPGAPSNELALIHFPVDFLL